MLGDLHFPLEPIANRIGERGGLRRLTVDDVRRARRLRERPEPAQDLPLIGMRGKTVEDVNPRAHRHDLA